MGDFNLIGNANDKQGGSIRISQRVEEFQEFMFNAELFDIPSKGLTYTWDNKIVGGENVRDRIDHALGNDIMLDAFPYQSVTHLPIIGSDHSPLLYQSCSPLKKQCKKFKFESMWTMEDSCEDAIRASWSNLTVNDDIVNLRQRLFLCARDLSSWSRQHFDNNKKIIGEITTELAYLQTLLPTIENGSRQRLLLSKLEEMWLREEMFCHQRSRVNWLKYVDQNSRFFHMSTIHRSQRNSISRLKNEQGHWVDNPTQLHKLILKHFSDLYFTSGSRNFNEVLDMLTPVVSNSMSLQLEAQSYKLRLIKQLKV